MSKYEVSKARLTRKNLKFEKGAWVRKGKFTLNNMAAGTFSLKFENGYHKEFFLTISMNSYRYIRMNTFEAHRDIFEEQILRQILPDIEEQIAEIRRMEEKIEKPLVTVSKVEQFNTSEGIQFIVHFNIGDVTENQVRVYKDANDNWFTDYWYNYENNIGLEMTVSSWKSHVWESIRDHEQLKLALLL